jgi:S-(hydroxymethyl)glutathione dehydrogenase / alcohol dehydrogenase
MKAAVCYEFGKPLVIEDVEIDPPHKGEVKVRVTATGVCHSDIHDIKGELPGPLPFVPGHECAGYVVETGEGVSTVRAGDPVVVTFIPHCGKCFYCTSGFPHLCHTEWPLDTETRLRNRKGQPLIAKSKTGAFAEYVVVEESQAVKVPVNMPLDRAALLACAVITGFGAVVNRMQVKPMSSVVVIGCGGIGLNALQGAAFAGADPIIAIDITDLKLKASIVFGATHTINAAQCESISAVKQLTGGLGADYVFITLGSAKAIQQGFSMTGPRGAAVIIGLPPVTESLTLPPLEFVRDERSLTGCFMGSVNLGIDIPRLASLYLGGRLKLDELITGRYPLDRINEAIASLESGETLRNMIIF